MSNCPLCEIDFPTDDFVVLQEHFVTAHSVDSVGNNKNLSQSSTENRKVRV